MSEYFLKFISVFLHLTVVFFFSPLLLGVIAKTKAFFAGRRGPVVLQPYYDIFKLFRKGSVYSTTTTWIFRAAPVVSLSAAVVSSFFIPLGGLKAPVQFLGDVILFASLFAMARFFMILAAWDTGSSFEGMGASREAAFSCLVEMVLFLDFVILALISKSLSLSGMLAGNGIFLKQSLGPALVLVIISYFLILLTENARMPVDDPATHLELTMIHEAMILDHSGVDLAYMIYSGAVKLFVLGGFLISLVLPLQSFDVFGATAIFLFGLIMLAVVIGIVESIMARIRLNRVAYLLIAAFVLAVFGLILTLTIDGKIMG